MKFSFDPFTIGQLNVKRFKLLNSYRGCFANTLDELGCTHHKQKSTNLNDDISVVYRPHRLSQKEREEVQILVSD